MSDLMIPQHKKLNRKRKPQIQSGAGTAKAGRKRQTAGQLPEKRESVAGPKANVQEGEAGSEQGRRQQCFNQSSISLLH